MHVIWRQNALPLNPDDLARRTLDALTPADEADEQTRFAALVNMWRACRAWIPATVGITDADLERLQASREFYRTGPGSKPLPWQRGPRADMVAVYDAEIDTLHRRRAMWAAICALLDESDEAVFVQAIEADSDGEALRPFFVLFSPHDPGASVPEYRRYVELFWKREGEGA